MKLTFGYILPKRKAKSRHDPIEFRLENGDCRHLTRAELASSRGKFGSIDHTLYRTAGERLLISFRLSLCVRNGFVLFHTYGTRKRWHA